MGAAAGHDTELRGSYRRRVQPQVYLSVRFRVHRQLEPSQQLPQHDRPTLSSRQLLWRSAPATRQARNQFLRHAPRPV
ncbi:hypothetical protein VTK73DRAFT_1651 [Phialemonium thermophilum]|uniref:Uncharacterized protein n=1 Tax=Phialemonium thermophilum TaxID=223376 RepID=A0ABR3X9F6_9PEZI